MRYALILNGPNLNLLGQRQPEIYGTQTLDDIIAGLRREFPDIRIDAVQSNHEGALIDAIHSTNNDPECVGIVLNPGAYAHTSLAIADAILSVTTPVIEVHLSNIAAREPVRQKSFIAPVCRGTITGLGAKGYALALHALL